MPRRYETLKETFEGVNIGISAVVVSDQFGSQMMQQFPLISKSVAVECYSPASMKMKGDFYFKEIFTRM